MFTIDIPVRVLFGAGRLGELASQPLPGGTALLITSSGHSTIANGSQKSVTELLSAKGIRVHLFDRVDSNPTLAIAQQAVDFAREMQCTMIVGLGGGSVMDTATVVAAIAPQKRSSVWDYVKAGSGGGYDLTEAPLYCVEIATSAGTGSEVDKIGVKQIIYALVYSGFGSRVTHQIRGFVSLWAISSPYLTHNPRV